MNKIFEFIKNDDFSLLINEIKMLIYYDGEWIFPVIGFEIMNNSLEINITKEIEEFVKDITKEMNKRNVNPQDWINDFNKIIKDLTKL
jgi:hypothetical protein